MAMAMGCRGVQDKEELPDGVQDLSAGHWLGAQTSAERVLG